MKLNTILKLIKSNQEKLEELGVKKIGIFGSYVKGNNNEKSDIDVLVEFEKGKKSFDNYMETKIFLETLFNKKVDLVIYEAIKEEIKINILNEVVYVS